MIYLVEGLTECDHTKGKCLNSTTRWFMFAGDEIIQICGRCEHHARLFINRPGWKEVSYEEAAVHAVMNS